MAVKATSSSSFSSLDSSTSEECHYTIKLAEPFQTSNNKRMPQSKGKTSVDVEKYSTDVDQDDVKSEGSLGLDDLMKQSSSGDLDNDPNNDEKGRHKSSRDQINICQGDDSDIEDDEWVDVDSRTFQIPRKLSSATDTSSRRHRRRRENKRNDWENISSCTVYSTGNDSCIFDMSSRSLLDDCNFEFEADAVVASSPSVRFSAGNLRTNRSNSALVSGIQGEPTWDGNQMTRITEHAQESSDYESQSELSDRHSFASTGSLGVYEIYQHGLEARLQRQQNFHRHQ